MSDLIERQDAIRAFDDAGFCSHDYVVGTLKDLPSAQPTQTNADLTHTNALDCVSRQAAIDAMRKLPKWDVKREDCKNEGFLYDDVMFALEKLPSAQPERKKGKWIKISPANIYECSECGKNVMTDDISAYDFCHGCGADMRGESDD